VEESSHLTRSELIERLAEHVQIDAQQVEAAIKGLIRHMSNGLASGECIEVRSFGSFGSFPCIRCRLEREGIIALAKR
jgi:nucleoid DNA-binding protein